MGEALEADSLSIEERVARLEGKLGWRDEEVPLIAKNRNIAAGLLVVAIILGYLGLGIPNHYYQVVLAALIITLSYHRKWLAWPKYFYGWGLAALNTALLSLLLKIVIGTGNRFPLSWVQYPVFKRATAPEETSWTDVVPDYELSWAPTAFSEWSVDITIIQTFLLLITLLGAWVEFQPFVSFTALLLIIFSLPALASFDWPLVFPCIVIAAAAFYIQSSGANS